MVDILKKEVTKDFDAAVEHIVKVVEKEGFTVMLTKSIDGILKKKLGITDYPRYTSIMACGPELAKMALDASLNVGLVFPCSFVVYEENEKIYVSHVSIMKMAKELGLASAEAMDPIIEITSKMVHKAWEQF
ncbi:MAG: DUF302 domain-containing protein [Asgard group archaeon]|nr:DUF302 domain-containing protein [Asgard group archaeon]